MILVGLGSNLSGKWGNPQETLRQAMNRIENSGLNIAKKTPIIETAPIGSYAGGTYANALIEIDTFCPPDALLRKLKWIEHQAGRTEARYASVLGRLPRWRPRVLDLDILDWHGIIRGPQDGVVRQGYVPLTLPHPALSEREFIYDLLGELSEV